MCGRWAGERGSRRLTEAQPRWSEGEARAAGDGAERGRAGGLWSRPAAERGYAEAGGADSGGFGSLRVTVWIWDFGGDCCAEKSRERGAERGRTRTIRSDFGVEVGAEPLGYLE